MRNYIALLIAFVLISTIQAKPNDSHTFFEGMNEGFGMVVEQDQFLTCNAFSDMTLKLTSEFLASLLLGQFNNAYSLLDEPIRFGNYSQVLSAWETQCKPVSSAYDKYFNQAVESFRQDRKAFFSTILNNFKSNEIEVIESAISTVELLISHDEFEAGKSTASIIKVLLSTWL